MSKHTAASKERLAGGILLGAVASGVTAAALGSAGTAVATCASISGIGNGNGCTSTPTSFAIGIGDKTIAEAKGLFTGAIALGPDNNATDSTIAASRGALSLAIAIGKNTQASTNGNLGLAVAQGQGVPGNPVEALAGLTPGDNLNVALNLGAKTVGAPENQVFAIGQANLAVNNGGNSTATRPLFVQAFGTGNAAFNIAGDANFVSAGNLSAPLADTGVGPGTPSTLGLAFNVFGNNNSVTAIGPLAIAGAVGKDNLNGANRVLQLGAGVNINNL